MLQKTEKTTLENQGLITELDKTSEGLNQDLSYNSTSLNIPKQENFQNDLAALVQTTFCMWEINSFISSYFHQFSSALSTTDSYFPGSMPAPSIGSIEGVSLSELKGTMYENYMIYSKNDINLQLLKQFDYKTVTRMTSSGRSQTVYICSEENCNKEFLRTCNLLDHMRMHSGIKPNVCEYCGKGFTQK